jgi:transposase
VLPTFLSFSRLAPLSCFGMVLQRQTVHPKGLSPGMKRKVWVLRKEKIRPRAKTWLRIASKVKNLAGGVPYWKVCRDAYNELEKPRRVFKDKYANCGRKPTLTKEVSRWIVRRMLKLRASMDVTSTDLSQILAKERAIEVEASSLRKVLNKAGYRYLARSKKPKYSKEQKLERMEFSQENQDEEIHMFMDGCVFTVPPTNPTERENYCKSDIKKVWRRPGEHDLPELAGHDRYARQVPPHRIVPLWGGLAAGGFAAVLWHEERKTDEDEWSQAVRDGNLSKALRLINGRKKNGPWNVLCDNESFLRTKKSLKALERPNVTFIDLPARSPDLNPVEKMWGWVRRQLRVMDLRDLSNGVPVLGKTMYRERIKRLLRSQKAQQVAKRFATNFRTICKRVIKAKGAAVKG